MRPVVWSVLWGLLFHLITIDFVRAQAPSQPTGDRGANSAAVGSSPGVKPRQDVVALSSDDISFLWPAPDHNGDLDGLIAADFQLPNGVSLWPKESFTKVLKEASSTDSAVVATSGEPKTMGLPDAVKELSSWKLASIRVDPSAPGFGLGILEQYGATPQIRLVFQPTTFDSDGVRVHDFAAHVVYDFVASALNSVPAVPDREAFGQIVSDLVKLKLQLRAHDIHTTSTVGVHPGFRATTIDLTSILKAFLAKHLVKGRISRIGFVGVRRPEPWFFLHLRPSDHGFTVNRMKNVGEKPVQMLFTRDPRKVIPEPTTALGVNTAALLRWYDLAIGAERLEESLSPKNEKLSGLRLEQIPDLIANPTIAHFDNTDCVSCHTESSIRREFGLVPTDSRFRYARPAWFTGVRHEADVPEGRVNVRNYGWRVVFRTGIPTASTRTANEAAALCRVHQPRISAHEVHRPKPIVRVKPVDPRDQDEVPRASRGTEGADRLDPIRPEAKNPITQAMNRLGTVHNARFAFVGDHLLIITVYDGDFNEYIDLFIDELGCVFTKLLVHLEGWPEGKTVQENRQLFLDFIRKHDIPTIGELYRAYPGLGVEQIKALGGAERR